MKSFADLKIEFDARGSINSISNNNGCYIVYTPENFEVIIKRTTDAVSSYIKNGVTKNLIYPELKLNTKLNSIHNRTILYIGKAERGDGGLRKRITEFVRYGYGLCNNHRGGRAIWQIENNKALLLDYFECENAEIQEKQMLKEFKAKHGSYPFANWRL